VAEFDSDADIFEWTRGGPNNPTNSFSVLSLAVLLQVFEELLLDADWALNAGNWMWLSASAFFHQYFRVVPDLLHYIYHF